MDCLLVASKDIRIICSFLALLTVLKFHVSAHPLRNTCPLRVSMQQRDIWERPCIGRERVMLEIEDSYVDDYPRPTRSEAYEVVIAHVRRIHARMEQLQRDHMAARFHEEIIRRIVDEKLKPYTLPGMPIIMQVETQESIVSPNQTYTELATVAFYMTAFAPWSYGDGLSNTYASIANDLRQVLCLLSDLVQPKMEAMQAIGQLSIPCRSDHQGKRHEMEWVMLRDTLKVVQQSTIHLSTHQEFVRYH